MEVYSEHKQQANYVEKKHMQALCLKAHKDTFTHSQEKQQHTWKSVAGVSCCSPAALSSSPSGAALSSVSAPRLPLCSPPLTAWTQKQKKQMRIGNRNGKSKYSNLVFFSVLEYNTWVLLAPLKSFGQFLLTWSVQPKQLFWSGGRLYTATIIVAALLIWQRLAKAVRCPFSQQTFGLVADVTVNLTTIKKPGTKLGTLNSLWTFPIYAEKPWTLSKTSVRV